MRERSGARSDHFRVTISLNGRNLGIWDTKDGGETDSEETRYKSGGGPQESLGGTNFVTQITASRMFRRGRDDELMAYMRKCVGSGEAVVKVLTLDSDGNPWTTGETYTGVWKRVSPPSVDSNSTDVAMVECEITPDAAVV